MRRREFLGALGGAAASWLLAARGQRSPKSVRLGYFAPAANADLLAALRSGLRDFGYVEGQNFSRETTGFPKRSLISISSRAVSKTRWINCSSFVRETCDLGLQLSGLHARRHTGHRSLHMWLATITS